MQLAWSQMTWDWQQIVALAFVAGAVFLLARRAYRWWTDSTATGCASGCQSCALKDSAAPARKPLVALSLPQRNSGKSQPQS
jgi:hypothetical protein